AEGETQEDTEWFRIVAWNKLAEICNQWLSKGSRVYVEGRMQTRQWQDQEGQTRYLTEVIANDIIILDSWRDGQPASSAKAPAEPPVEAPLPTAPRGRSAASAEPASARQPATSVGAPARAAKVAALPRGKDAFEEEDLPF
ncbi:MAG TPA: single-stranded DNA-binding protein, partial [Roseiflexaceae bacterium]|nr:single-stranded DNA-binding protein [Roseiflexaceae bacterium]